MSTKITKDLNSNQAIDADFGGFKIEDEDTFYQLQKEGNAFVHAEKYLVGKATYQPLPVGTPMVKRPNMLLIKEDSYTDFGGGYATVRRHYARRPNSWFDYEMQECLLYDALSYTLSQAEVLRGFRKFVTRDNIRGVNYDLINVGIRNNISFGYVARARRQFTFLCKATRYYLTLEELDEYKDNDFSLAGVAWEGTSIYPDGFRDNTFTTVSDGEGGTYQKPNHLFVNEPRWRQNKNDASLEGSITPDRITKWQGNFYELTRYTTSLY